MDQQMWTSQSRLAWIIHRRPEMLYYYIHNPGRPIRKIQHIPITAAGIFKLPKVQTAGRNTVYSINPTETALWSWSSTNLGIVIVTIVFHGWKQKTTFTWISQCIKITNFRFSHDGFRIQMCCWHKHSLLPPYLSVPLSGHSVSGGTCWSVCFIHIQVIFECVSGVCFMASISCSYNLMSLWRLATTEAVFEIVTTQNLWSPLGRAASDSRSASTVQSHTFL